MTLERLARGVIDRPAGGGRRIQRTQKAVSPRWSYALFNAQDSVTVSLINLLDTEVDSIMGIEMAAYSVHCIANPLIAVIRDRRLESTLAHILMRNKRHTPDQELIVALMRDPPPPYST
ncbi:hypothetical protein OSTOST_03383 [Ostertagia ostertagi]